MIGMFKDCSNCENKDEPWLSFEAKVGDICFDCVKTGNMHNWKYNEKE